MFIYQQSAPGKIHTNPLCWDEKSWKCSVVESMYIATRRLWKVSRDLASPVYKKHFGQVDIVYTINITWAAGADSTVLPLVWSELSDLPTGTVSTWCRTLPAQSQSTTLTAAYAFHNALHMQDHKARQCIKYFYKTAECLKSNICISILVTLVTLVSNCIL